MLHKMRQLASTFTPQLCDIELPLGLRSIDAMVAAAQMQLGSIFMLLDVHGRLGSSMSPCDARHAIT